jgi:hypothetical protein
LLRCVAGLGRVGHLGLLKANQEPSLGGVGAEMHEAAGHLLGKVLQTGLNHGVVSPYFPSYPLSSFVNLSGDGRLLSTQDVLVGTADHPFFVNGELEEHVGVTLLFMKLAEGRGSALISATGRGGFYTLEPNPRLLCHKIIRVDI